MSEVKSGLASFVEKAMAAFAIAGEAVRMVLDETYKKGQEDGYKQGYQLGYQAGREAMKEAILRAANAPLSLEGPALDLEAPTNGASDPAKANRVPRGTVRQFISRQIELRGPQPESSLKQLAELSGEDLSPHSISNELRRMEGTKYRRDDQGRWHLLPEDPSVVRNKLFDDPAQEAAG